MNIGRLLFAAGMSAALTLGACETAPTVSVIQSPDLAITPGSTYAWAPTMNTQGGHGDPRIDNDIIRDRIRLAVNQNLGAKGYRLVDNPSEAQLLVAYYIGLQQGTDYRVSSYGGYYGGYGYGWGMYGAPMDTDVRAINYVDGTLILDLKDRASNKLAWRATSQKRLDQGAGTPEKVNATVALMVQSLPALAPPPPA